MGLENNLTSENNHRLFLDRQDICKKLTLPDANIIHTGKQEHIIKEFGETLKRHQIKFVKTEDYLPIQKFYKNHPLVSAYYFPSLGLSINRNREYDHSPEESKVKFRHQSFWTEVCIELALAAIDKQKEIYFPNISTEKAAYLAVLAATPSDSEYVCQEETIFPLIEQTINLHQKLSSEAQQITDQIKHAK